MRIADWQKYITKWAVEHGFDWKQTDIEAMLNRLFCEVGEASEETRDFEFNNGEIIPTEAYVKFSEELADVAIRLFHLAEVSNIDLETQIKLKMKINESRPYRHGHTRK